MQGPRLWALAAALLAGLILAPVAGAASLFDKAAGCIRTPPATWVSAPAKPGDQFTVWAPAGDDHLADGAAGVIRSKDFFGYYEDKLSIPRLGQPGQGGLFQVYLDPQLQTAEANLDGVETGRCGVPNADAVDVRGTLTGEDLGAVLAHELFHAAQAQLGGEISDNWWYEATATWAETRFGYQDPRRYSTSVTDHPALPMDAYAQAVDGADLHEYGAWTFVAWLFSHGKIGWHQLRQSFVSAAHADPTPVINQLLGGQPEAIGNEVASYWGDHLNKLPRFGPTARLVVDRESTGTTENHFPTAPYLGARTIAIRPAHADQQMVLIIKKLPAGVQVWVKLDKGSDFQVLGQGDSFNETFCRTGATAGSYELPKPGEVRLAITSIDRSPPPDVEVKVITSPHPCPKELVVVPGLAIGELHLGMTLAEAHKAAPRHTKLVGPVPTPWGKFEGQSFNVHDQLVGAYFLNGRIADLFAGGHAVRTTDGLRGLEVLLPPNHGDDPSGPLLLVGNTLAEFGTQHCKPMAGKPPGRYCWHEGPSTRYTLATAAELDPCPVDSNETPTDGYTDGDTDQRVCTYPKDLYIIGFGVATSKGLKLFAALQAR